MVDVRSRAHRILKPLSHYQDLSEGGELLIPLPSPPTLHDPERLLGIYTTLPHEFSDAILFTTAALYVRQNASWLKLPYSEIEHTVPPESKQNVTGFSVKHRNAGEVWITVKGSKAGRFFDAFTVLRFIDRVISDLKKAEASSENP